MVSASPLTSFLHSRVRARTKAEAERIGKYMVRPILALGRLIFLESEGKVGYRHGPDGAELEGTTISRRLEEVSGLPSLGRFPGRPARKSAAGSQVGSISRC